MDISGIKKSCEKIEKLYLQQSTIYMVIGGNDDLSKDTKAKLYDECLELGKKINKLQNNIIKLANY